MWKAGNSKNSDNGSTPVTNVTICWFVSRASFISKIAVFLIILCTIFLLKVLNYLLLKCRVTTYPGFARSFRAWGIISSSPGKHKFRRSSRFFFFLYFFAREYVADCPKRRLSYTQLPQMSTQMLTFLLHI